MVRTLAIAMLPSNLTRRDSHEKPSRDYERGALVGPIQRSLIRDAGLSR